MRLPRIPLSVSIATALGLRLLIAFIAFVRVGPAIFEVSDSHGYQALARNLWSHHEFALWPGRTEIYRTPAYPLLLSPSPTVPYALFLNLLLSLAIVASVFFLARRLFGDDVLAGICAFVAAIEPTMLAWSLKMMPETLLTLCILAFVACALRALETRDVRWTCAAAFALCAAAYVKPIAWPLVPVIIVASLVARSPRHSLALLLACVALLAPWHIRNARLTGFAGFTTLMDRALYLGAGGSVVARNEHRPYEEVHKEMVDRSRIRRAPDTELQYSRIRREGASLVASDPIGYALTHAKRTARMLIDPGAVEYLRFSGLYSEGGQRVLAQPSRSLNQRLAQLARTYPLAVASSLVLAILLLPLLLLPILGATRVPRELRGAFFLLAFVTAYFIAVSGGVAPQPRFRVPFVPLLILMSAFAIKRAAAAPAQTPQ